MPLATTLEGPKMPKRTNPGNEKRSRSFVTYSSRIIKAGALLGDTRMFLSHWDTTTSVSENIDRIQRDNVFGKASRARVKDIMVIFRQRYLGEESVTNALVTLVKARFATAALDRILYFHSARADRLINDAVTEILVPMHQQGLLDINSSDFRSRIMKWVEEGKTVGHWSEITVTLVCRGLLAVLRDFGILQGATKKNIAPVFLPTEAFAYIAFYLRQHQPSGSKLLELPDWKLFFLTSEAVERFLFEAHQRDLLEYHVAGSVTRLTFPADTLEEYANVLAQR